MRYFIGKNEEDNVPLANGELLACLQQYEKGDPIDKVNKIYYPYYDRDSSILGRKGSFFICKDRAARLWYAPHNMMFKQDLGEWGGYLSIDQTRYVDGLGIYEVISHKGYNVVKTTTWVSYDTNVLIRQIEVRSVLSEERIIDIFPCIDLRGGCSLIEKEGEKFILSKVRNYGQSFFVAATVAKDDLQWHLGDFIQGSKNGFNQKTEGTGQLVIFKITRKVTKKDWSQPAYLVLGFGRFKEEAIKNAVMASDKPTKMRQSTLNKWNKWLAKGTDCPSKDNNQRYQWRLSQTLIKMCMQKTGELSCAGFQNYMGCVWIRDSIWTLLALLETGHIPEAKLVVNSLINTVSKRSDGNLYFNYNCRTGKSMEHTYENDSAGLFLIGITGYIERTEDYNFLTSYLDIIIHCADWIKDNTDNSGMVIPDAGIWETFGKATDREHEHMAWTSGVSAFGLSRLAVLLKKCGYQNSKYYGQYAAMITKAIRNNCIKDDILCRSAETENLDASVLNFFTRMQIFEPKETVVRKTIAAIEKRLVDQLLGGVWRHEDLTCDLGDGIPWHGCTLWLAEALAETGKIKKAQAYLKWVMDNSSYCGLIPECMLTRGICRGIPMPSYSHAGFLMALKRLNGK